MLYWRTASGHEPVEVKASERVGFGDARHLEVFLDEYPDLADGGPVLYGGSEILPLTKRVLAAPWWAVC